MPKKGYKFTEKQRANMSRGHQGYPPWNKGAGGCKRGHDPALYKRMPSGIFVCLGCKRENGAKYRGENRESINLKNRVGRYRITLEDYETLYQAQQGRCAICREILTENKRRIDHDHRTGKVRGILCTSCNTGIGLFQDSSAILEQAEDYLHSHGP